MMRIIYQICEITATVTETFILLEFINRLLGTKYKGLKNAIVTTLSFVVINTYMIFVGIISPEYSAMSDFVVLSLYILYTLLFVKGNAIYKLITPAMCITAIVIINVSVNIITSYLFKAEPNELIVNRNILRVASLFITKFAFFLLTRIVLKIIKPKSIILNKSEFISVSLMFLISVVIVIFATEIQYHVGSNEAIEDFMIILLIGMIVINIMVFFLFNIIAKKNNEKIQYSMIEMKYEEQKKSYESVKNIYDNLQILQHDLKNELLSLYNIIDKNQNEQAKRYIENITNTKLDTFHEYIKTGNDIVDAIINIKLNIARENNIEIMCNINADFNGFDSNDIVNLLSNAIDNAIESSMKQKLKKIIVSIETKRNYLCISIANSIDFSVLKTNSHLSTTKNDKKNHGFGTQSMKQITEKYDGMIEYYEKDEMFVVNILMKNV